MPASMNGSQVLEFDFVVVGGGVAGVCTAIAAARLGLRTAIVQDRPMFGGNSSSEIRVAPISSAGYCYWTRETGILEELLLLERLRNHDDVNDGMASSHYDLVLYEIVKRESNLSMFLNTTARAVGTEPDPSRPDGRRITAVHASQLASEKEFIFKAAQFADCTGDATVGFLAGAEFRRGREGRSEFDEPLAPPVADNQTMGSTLTMRARNIGRPVEFVPPEWVHVYKTAEEIGMYREPNRFNRVDYGGYWWIEVGTPFDQIDDNQAIKEELFRHVLGVWNYVKNYSPDKEAAANYALEWVGQVPGKRESRRLVGDVLLTEHDCHHDRQWPDRVGYSGCFIDLHTMGGILSKNEPGEPAWADCRYRHYVRIPPFSIPLRGLYSRNVTNLWMAGRDISVTHVALGPVRNMLTLGLLGQSVGTAAAYAIPRSLTPRQVADPAGPHISAVQQQLLKDDVNAFGVRNCDQQDLALNARATATSEAKLDLATHVAPDDCVDLTSINQGFIFPVTHARVEALEVYLKNPTDKEIVARAELHQLDQLWQRETGQVAARFAFRVPAGSAGWTQAEVNAAVQPNKPCRLAIFATPGLLWAKCRGLPTGTHQQLLHASPGGYEPRNANIKTLREIDLPAYEHWLQFKYLGALSMRITPTPEPYGAANVNNGFAWPYVMPNLWVSDPGQRLPQSVTLDFGTPQQFNTVYVSFDTNLRQTYHEMRGFHRSHTCAKDWRLLALVDGQWRQVYEERGNFLRRRKAVFAPVIASQLKVEILNTNATAATDVADEGKSARVYEIRVYQE